MEKQEIIDGNKLIARTKYATEDVIEWVKDIGNPSDTFCLNTLKYHKSWDWLIPVIQKINEDFNYTIVKPYDIQMEYTEVVKFIKWINSNDTGRNK